MPLYIIFPKLAKLPSELKKFANNGQAYFTSSGSRWQKYDTFLFFVISISKKT